MDDPYHQLQASRILFELCKLLCSDLFTSVILLMVVPYCSSSVCQSCNVASYYFIIAFQPRSVRSFTLPDCTAIGICKERIFQGHSNGRFFCFDFQSFSFFLCLDFVVLSFYSLSVFGIFIIRILCHCSSFFRLLLADNKK